MKVQTQQDRDHQFALVYNDIEKYPTLGDVARAIGRSVKTVKNIASILRLKSEAPKLVSRSKMRLMPLSEIEEKFSDATAEECIAELRAIAEAEPERFITREYFRHHSTLADSVWSRHFGSFQEFRRQAGLELTRTQASLEREVAKHVSVDHYRRLGAERMGYAERYLRENSRRFKTVLVCSDLHDIEIDTFFLRVLLDVAHRAQPDVIALVGDIFDLPEFGKYGVDPREWGVVKRIQFAHDRILGPLRKACPNSQIDLIEGNHENRLIRHLADATPAMRVVLSDLHGWTVSRLLGLDQFEINYVAKSDLGTFIKRDHDRELAKNYKVYWDALLCHHFPYARNMGLPGVNGHHHQHVVWSQFSPVFGAYEWHQLGSGHRRSASYTEGEKWHNGFALVHIDTHTKSTVFDYIPITDHAVAGGKWYHREAGEQ